MNVTHRHRPVTASIQAALALAAALMVLASPAAAMTFTAVAASGGCGEQTCIQASGPIDKDSVAAFQAFVRAHRIEPGAVVALNSEGGVLLFGMALGDEIRKDGLSTTVQAAASTPGSPLPDECASACVFSFLGGVERSVGKGARLGVHQIYSNGQARDALSVADAQWLTSLAAAHIDRMGGRLGILVLCLRTPPQDIHWFSVSELDRLDVVTTDAAAVVAMAN
jgi:hypothetical protein